MKFAQWAKAYVALAGLIAAGVAGVPDIPLGWKIPLAIVIAVAGAVAVWKVENAPADSISPDDFDFDPPAPNWKSAGPAWEEPGVMPVGLDAPWPVKPDDPEPPKKNLYLVPPLPASYYLSRAEENEVRVA